MKSLSCITIGLMCLFHGFKIAEAVLLPIAHDLGENGGAVHVHPLRKIMLSGLVATRVPRVFGTGALPQVGNPVVGRVVVDVVDLHDTGVFSVAHEPHNPVDGEQFSPPLLTYPNFTVPFFPVRPRQLVTGFSASVSGIPQLRSMGCLEMRVWPSIPQQDPLLRIVVEQFPNKVERWESISAIAATKSHFHCSHT